ncbi:CDP-glycerol glycerophosphotransferase family protein [Haemophilus haemoglobinophilus]|nr:CDP-glycerol glycerophosphotransferase family protein [Canicola haemoglobinophilus]
MKNNQNKYNKQRALILLKGILPSFFGYFIPKIRKRIIFNSTRNEFYNFNSKHLFEYFIKNHPEYDVRFVINDDKKRKELNELFPNKNYFIETKSLSGIWFALRAKAWIVSALETPVGGFFQKINRFVYHLGHGAYFRSAVFLEKKLILKKKIYYSLIKNNFSHHLITSSKIAKIAPNMFGCSLNQIVVLGEPMNDAIFSPKSYIIDQFVETGDKNIIYMPTWRQDSNLRLFPFEDMSFEKLSDFLEENKINLFLRLHPSYEEDLSIYTGRTSRIKVLDTKIVEDVNDVIGFFDLVITDYSSGHLGYLLTQKPVMFLPYDLREYNNSIGFIFPYDEATPGPKPTTLNNFILEIEKLLTDKNYYLLERIETIKLFHNYVNNNCKMNADFIIGELEK